MLIVTSPYLFFYSGFNADVTCQGKNDLQYFKKGPKIEILDFERATFRIFRMFADNKIVKHQALVLLLVNQWQPAHAEHTKQKFN